jgi:ATP-dependent HslUV protease ATP-binding subunit HslU
MVNAPFVKVEATKFTEVGYVGRDVEAIIRELVETSVRMVRQERMAAVEKEAEKHATERLLNLLSPLPRQSSAVSNPFGALLGIAGKVQPDAEGSRDEEYEEKLAQARQRREILSQRLQRGELEEELVEIEVEDNSLPFVELFSGTGEEIGVNFHELLGGMLPKRKKKRRVSVKVAAGLLIQEEAAKMIDMDEVTAEAIRRTEEMG